MFGVVVQQAKIYLFSSFILGQQKVLFGEGSKPLQFSI
jgi:hypothetical protein